MNIKNPPLKYYGAKWRLAPWVISHFPPHTHYIEIYGGAGGVLLRKDRSKLETYNDIWDSVVNFFRVLRDDSDELIRKIELTPWARTEFESHFEPTTDPIEAARRFWVGCNMAIGSMAFTPSGMRTTKDLSKIHVPHCSSIKNIKKQLYNVADRLQGIQIENLHYAKLIKNYELSAPQQLFYFDPPYTINTRSSSNVYHHEFTEQDHRQAAKLLRASRAYVIVSGYKSKLYKELYEDFGWCRIDRNSQTNQGSIRVESLWLNEVTWQNQKQMSLF